MKAGFLIVCAVAAASAMIVPRAARADGDPAAGKKAFTKCAICHNVEENKNKIGPSLFGVVGRHSATVPGFEYSPAMKSANKVWDASTLDVYLRNPRELVPGTKMVFVGLKDDTERQNVISYLETLK
jgi:cytochrome c